MLIFLNKIIPFFKYWKTGGLVLLAAAFLVSFHLAKSRGEKLDVATRMLEAERKKFQSQIKSIEKALQDDKERQNFRKNQNRKIKLAESSPLLLDSLLRDAYELLRARQAGSHPG